MKHEIKQLLRDLRAAAILARPEAVDIALNGLLAIPGVASNDRMNDGFIQQVILPVGKSLTTLRASEIRPLLTHQLSAGRAIGAVALAHLFITGKNATQKDLRKPASDPRADVRSALGQALFSVGDTDPDKLRNLGTTWLMQSAPKLRHTALIFVPALASKFGQQIVGLVGPIVTDEDYDVRAALVDCINTLGRGELAEPVLKLLALWVSEPQPNAWVISRVLSASWVVDYPHEVEPILKELQAKAGDSSQVSNALKALHRHGLEIDLN